MALVSSSHSERAEKKNMEEAEKFQITCNTVLCSDSAHYQVMDLIADGGFGVVVKCLNSATGNTVAVKIHKNSEDDRIENEIAVLKVVQTVDPDKKNIVKFIENFRFQELSCLVFEMLDQSIWDLMKERKWAPLSLHEIRTITQQVLVAFDALKGLGIIYCDLKLDNIMLVNHSEQPLKIKLIDFDLALPESRVKVGMMMQLLTFRAPEVTLGLPLTTAIDMWSLGCNMAEIYFGIPFFPEDCEYEWMKVMLHLLGQPDTNLLAEGEYTSVFFTLEDDLDKQYFRFKSQEEYKEYTGNTPHVLKNFLHSVKSLDHVVLEGPRKLRAAEKEDGRAFLNLLKCCLTVDARKRITPGEALNHSFITSHQESQPPVCDYDHTNMDEQPGPSTASSHGSDLQANRPSGENSDRPQSCHTADSNETYSDIDLDTEGSSCYKSLFYTTSNENDGSPFETPPSSYTATDNVPVISTQFRKEEPRNDTRTSPDRPQQKTFGERVQQFFQRVRKGLITILICGANHTH